MAGFDAEAFKKELKSEQTRAIEQLKSELAEQTRAIIREMMREIIGAVRQKQPAQQQPIDLDAKNSVKRQIDDDVEKLLTNPTSR